MEKKPPRKAEQLHRAVQDSVDFKRSHQARELQRQKLAAARKWLRLPLADFLREVGISESDPEYKEFVAIWSEFHE